MVTEHNLEVIKTADWIVDFGLEGGGPVVAVGTPEEIAAVEASYTGGACSSAHATGPANANR